jgi:hypothetical protein
LGDFPSNKGTQVPLKPPKHFLEKSAQKSPKNSQKIPKKFTKNPQKIPKKIPKKFTNICKK